MRVSLKIIMLISVFFFVSGCGDIGGSGQCGGVATAGTCVMISNMDHDYLDLNAPNVDVVFDPFCVNSATGEATAPEPFTDHFVNITFANTPLPGADIGLIPVITIKDYSIDYSLNGTCPDPANAATVCPDISREVFIGGTTFTIAPEESVTKSFPLMPVRKKTEFVANNSSTNAYPSYTAVYVFNGSTTFNQPISVSGSVEFTIGNYSFCGSGG